MRHARQRSAMRRDNGPTMRRGPRGPAAETWETCFPRSPRCAWTVELSLGRRPSFPGEMPCNPQCQCWIGAGNEFTATPAWQANESGRFDGTGGVDDGARFFAGDASLMRIVFLGGNYHPTGRLSVRLSHCPVAAPRWDLNGTGCGGKKPSFNASSPFDLRLVVVASGILTFPTRFSQEEATP